MSSNSNGSEEDLHGSVVILDSFSTLNENITKADTHDQKIKAYENLVNEFDFSTMQISGGNIKRSTVPASKPQPSRKEIGKATTFSSGELDKLKNSILKDVMDAASKELQQELVQFKSQVMASVLLAFREALSSNNGSGNSFQTERGVSSENTTIQITPPPPPLPPFPPSKLSVPVQSTVKLNTSVAPSKGENSGKASGSQNRERSPSISSSGTESSIDSEASSNTSTKSPPSTKKVPTVTSITTRPRSGSGTFTNGPMQTRSLLSNTSNSMSPQPKRRLIAKQASTTAIGASSSPSTTRRVTVVKKSLTRPASLST